MEFHKDVQVKEITKEEGNSFSITTVEGETVTASYKFHSGQGEKLCERLLCILEKHIDEFMSNEFDTRMLTLFYNVDTQVYKFSNFVKSREHSNCWWSISLKCCCSWGYPASQQEHLVHLAK